MTARSFAMATFPVAESAAGSVPDGLLAFDTSLAALSVAVVRRRQGRLIAYEAFEARASGHAEHLMAMIGGVMDEAGLAFGEIARIAVTVGPGGFTGVRVGIAAARALALATGRPVAGVTSLAVLAQEAFRLLPAADARGAFAVAVAARGGMVYFQIFDAGPTAASPPQHLAPSDAAAALARRRLLVVGSGARAVGAAVAAAGGAPATALPELLPRARSLIALAAAAGGPVRPLYLAPHGARPPGAGALCSP
jgi:tRNA threonylcarbamoyladenosine biosynthesis protein TsaB